MIMDRSRRRLPLLVTASVALHAVAFALASPNPVRLGSLAEGELIVTLAEPFNVQSVPVRRSYSHAARAPEARRLPLSKPATEPLPVPSSPPASGDATREPDHSGDAPTSVAFAAVGERVRQLAAEELAKHFTYPSFARQRGWSGTVLLAFTLETNGRLEHIRVAASSGYALLDRSAASDLARIGHLEDAIAWLQGEPVAVTLPVEYRLLEK